MIRHAAATPCPRVEACPSREPSDRPDRRLADAASAGRSRAARRDPVRLRTRLPGAHAARASRGVRDDPRAAARCGRGETRRARAPRHRAVPHRRDPDAPTGPRPCCSTGTTTSSRQATRRSGTRRRSRPRNATAPSTAAAPPTPSRTCSCTSARFGRGTASRPVGIKLVIEGQEETGSALNTFPPSRPELFAADAMLIADMGSLRPGRADAHGRAARHGGRHRRGRDARRARSTAASSAVRPPTR